jgi:hypothetical protein
MLWNDALMLVYNYRVVPKPEDVPHLFVFIEQERLLWKAQVGIMFSGIVTALCDRHPERVDAWRRNHAQAIAQAYAISVARRTKEDILFAEYLTHRWLILGNDESAWNLLKLCHCSNEAQRTAAQTACDKICRSIDNKPIVNSKGDLVGKTQFDDMRLQMLRLAREFSRMTPNERSQSFRNLPFSMESQQAQLQQGLLPAGALIQ